MAFNTAGTVLEQLGFMVYGELASAWGLKGDLKKLQRTMSVIKAVLVDAEEKQARNRELGIWLRQLKDIFLDAQDVLDEFECQVKRGQVVNKYGSTSRKIRRYFSRSNPVMFRLSISHKIKEIRQRLDEISSDKDNFHLIERDDDQEIQTGAGNGGQRRTRAAATHSFLGAGVVLGQSRNGDMKRIISYLLSDVDEKLVSVIPIQGVEGIGKTTLAKLVYNDHYLRDHFQQKIWVSVPAHEKEEDFDVPRIIRDIIIRCETNDDDLKENLSLDQLATRLQKDLEERSFLLVLDDVSNLNQEKWSEFLGFLEGVGSHGRNRIIVTTRKMSVASIVRSNTIPTYKLEGLSQEDSWSLFRKWTSMEGDGDGDGDQVPQHLEDIGRQIVKKCQGVPLAIKVLGSVFSKLNEEEWKFISDNEMWKLDLWIENQVLNQQGDEGLGNISSFQDVDKFGLLYLFYMHDLVNDLARFVLSHSTTESSIIDYPTKSVSERVQHLSFAIGSGLEDPACFKKVNSVRSILFPIPGIGPETTSFLYKNIRKLNYLRVLDLSDSSFDELPSYVGQMKLLRYLNLSRNVKIRYLPNSICKLQSLETLELAGCTKLEGLPRDVKCLESLTFLSITTTKAQFSETGIGSLGDSLRKLIITNCNALNNLPAHMMRGLTTLETLVVIDCENLRLTEGEDENEGNENNSIRLSLRTLVFMRLPEMAALPRWLLGGSSTLRYLLIEDCSNLTSLPQWLTRIKSLQKITIQNCENLSYLPDEVLKYLPQEYKDEYSQRQVQIEYGSPSRKEKHGDDEEIVQEEH